MKRATTTVAILAITLLMGCGGSADEESPFQTESAMRMQDKKLTKRTSDVLQDALAICTTTSA